MDRGRLSEQDMTINDSNRSLASAFTKGSPILFLNSDHSLSSKPAENGLIPVVRVSIRPAFLAERFKADPNRDPIDVLALIDTGADLVYIDHEFAVQNGFETNETAMVSGATGTQQQNVYPALFKLCDDAEHPTQAALFTSAPLRKNGRNYDLILGMQLLSNGVLIMDFDSHTYRFQFTTQADK